MLLINSSSFLYADNSTMTCRACHEECNDACSGPVSITFEMFYDINVYNRNLLTVLVDVKTLLFLLLIIQSLVFHNVQ